MNVKAPPEAGLRIVRSADVDALVDPLVDRLRAVVGDPFQPVRIAVQSGGMARWLSHQIAERLDPSGRGIRANVAFPFPGSVVADAIAVSGPDPDAPDPWSPDRLVWQVLRTLRRHAHDPTFARLTRFLRPGARAAGAGVAVDRRAWQLARTIADVFDGYVLSRPDVVRGWAAGDDTWSDGREVGSRDRWQPRLWRLLTDQLGDPTRRLDDAIARLGDPAFRPLDDRLRGGVAMFGISALPPRHLQLLRALATHVPVELYLPTVSPVRWELVADAPDREPPLANHPLLVSGGRLGDDAARLVLGLGAAEHRAVGAATEPRSLLEVVQADLRADRRPGSTGPIELELDRRGAVTDRSLQVHACHGPSRQVEVLRDVLLGLLSDEGSLEPRDVLVMTPDVETFAPLVQAAFGPGDEVPALPVRVADRSVGRSDPAVDALLAILDLAAGRVTASALLDVLEREPVASALGIDVQELPRIGTWVAETGIRWGIDADDRGRHGQPPDDVHTWRAGLDRLLVGVTMADEDDRLVAGVLPYDHVEGSDVDLAGRLAAGCAQLFDAVRHLRHDQPLRGWVTTLDHVAEQLIALGPDDAWRLPRLRAGLADIVDAAGPTADDTDLDLGALRGLVAAAVGRRAGAAGYETGAVTLCAMVPMRSIPHRVIAMLGMDDGAFPRPGRAVGFDLLERDHRTGDRDQRDEDRLLFLEAVLAARDHLIVTTTGRDQRTNEPRPPATPLAELLDVVDATATVSDGSTARDAITIVHPLQAVSPRNFGLGEDGRTVPARSFDRSHLTAAEATLSTDRQRVRFLDDRLPGDAGDDAVAGPRVVDLDALVSALVHPTRALLRTRLGLFLQEFVPAVEDREPLSVDALGRWAIGTRLLDEPDRRLDAGAPVAALLASGTVPAGTPGEVQVADIVQEVRAMRTHAAMLLDEHGVALDPDGTTIASVGGGAEDVRVDLHLGDHRLLGSLPGVVSGPDGRRYRIRTTFSRPKPRHRVRLWVEHLALTAVSDRPVCSWWVLRPKTSRSLTPARLLLAPLDPDPSLAMRAANEHLRVLLDLHDRALTEPLPLFEGASCCYAETGQLAQARRKFLPSDFGAAGDLDEDVAQAYGADADLDLVLDTDDARASFADLARRLWHPIIEHEQRSPEVLAAATADGAGTDA
jgi:exodeoxyribonuclease V gamma subunit